MRFRPWIGALAALALLITCSALALGQDPPVAENAGAATEPPAETEPPAASSAEAPSEALPGRETVNPREGNSTPPRPKQKEEQAQIEPGDLASPRATMRTLLRSAHEDDWGRAGMTLNVSQLDPAPTAEARELLAWRLKEIIDRLAYVKYDSLPDRTDEAEYTFTPGGETYPIVMAEGRDGLWRFNPATVDRIDTMYRQIQDQPKIQAPWYRRLHIGDNELWLIGALFLALLVAWILGKVLRTLLERTGTRMGQRRPLVGSTLAAMGRAAVPAALVLGLQIGLSFLVLNEVVRDAADVCVSILWTISIAFAVWCMVDVVETWLSNVARKTSSTLDDMLVPMMRTTLKATVVIMGLVQIATIVSNKPITSVIAGLGIGGLAIGLAAQDMVKNFFGSIMIFSDRPFEMGDRIQVDGFDGTIEAVGFRSTRLRTLDGHLVTIPNGSLANASIRNVSKRPNIRRILNLGLTYDTPPEKVRRAKAIVEELLADHEGMHPDLPPRVYFTEFNDSALNLNVIYWYHPPEWWDYNAFSENLNMEILTRFNAEGLDFAFPSQTIYLAGGGDTKPEELPNG